MNRVVFGGDAAAHPYLHEMARRFLSCRPQVVRMRIDVVSDDDYGSTTLVAVTVGLADRSLRQQTRIPYGQELNYAADEVFLALSSHVLAQPNVVVVPHSPEDAELAEVATAALNEALNEANGVDEYVLGDPVVAGAGRAIRTVRNWQFGANDGVIVQRIEQQRQIRLGAEAARLAGINELDPDPTIDPVGYIEWAQWIRDRERRLAAATKPPAPPSEPLKPRKINRALLEENNP